MNFVVALNAEARPLIDHFSLKLLNKKSEYKIYTNSSMYLVITGIGKDNCYKGCQYLHHTVKECSDTWINFGLAGHRFLPVGSLRQVNRVCDKQSEKIHYLNCRFEELCETADVMTVDKAEVDFSEDHLYDMEATAFVDICTRLSSVERLQCIKIVSDNFINPAVRLSHSVIYQLISEHFPIIDKLVEKWRH